MDKLVKEIMSVDKNDPVLHKIVKKNKYFGVSNIVLLSYVITLALHSFILSRKFGWRYLGTMTMLRIEEAMLCLLFFLVCESYTIGPESWLKIGFIPKINYVGNSLSGVRSTK
eukprot:TRINITY_DN10595_c0_g1_i2.p2 TRINITY_DN10595_c0_g1~~TRINITY_DN10595_c0_g1_i2.p2  ORF type:complete len:113 (-),score=2.61 TRINITY_DN10595_c0_g1_i2:203-541(-)